MLSNFRNLRKVSSDPFAEVFAEVDETTGSWFWKRTRTRTISLPNGVGFWIFVDTGHFTPGLQAENLARAFRAQQTLEEWEKSKQEDIQYWPKRTTGTKTGSKYDDEV